MPPIRKGDGTPVTPKGISQIRTGDGRILFDGVAIPDSGADHQWNYTTGSGTTVEDTIADLDLSYTSISDWPTDAGAGGTYAKLDETDDADVGDDKFTHFFENKEGTYLLWAFIDSGWSDGGKPTRSPWGTGRTSTNTNIGFEWRDDEYAAALTIDGNFNDVSGGTVSDHEGEWVASALVADGSNWRLYLATPGDYNVSELGSTSISGSDSGTWSQNLLFGADSNNVFEGGTDIQFVDSDAWTESEIQSFVNDSKEFYE